VGKFRHYSEETEALAERWAAKPLTSDRWELVGKVSDVLKKADTESNPQLAKCGPLTCIAKPGVKKTDNKPRAALEKIASDIAFHLGVSVEPAILWDRGGSMPVSEERHMCLIAWAFEPSFTWDEAAAHLTAPERTKVGPSASALWPFETWISAQDRGGKHLLVSLPNAGDVPQIAGIDYAFSMIEVWKDDPRHPDLSLPGWRPPIDPPQKTAILECVEAIEMMDESLIRDIVGLIPNAFLTDDQKRVIIANLLNRQNKIRQLFT
jgi:hypothetical protein